ncbi:MAG: hypothetical protein QM759_01825 [Terricaulis sp.]
MSAGRRDGVTTYESTAYLEQRFTENDSLVFSPWTEENAALISRSEATFGVKHVLTRSDHTVTAVQAGAVWVSEPPQHCEEGGAEVRFLGGVNLPRDTFINVEVAERILSGGCTDQRVEITAGAHHGPHWLGLAQVFVDGPEYGDESVKAELSLVHFDNKGHGVQVGVRGRVDGGDDELALVLAFWSEPGRARKRRRSDD